MIEAQAAGLRIIASDEVSEELNITGNIDFLSLNVSPEIWATRIIEMSSHVKKNTIQLIKEGNYDIKNNAAMLQDFYYNQINE